MKYVPKLLSILIRYLLFALVSHMFAFIPFVGLKDNFPEVDYVSKYSIIYNLYKRWLKDNKKEKED